MDDYERYLNTFADNLGSQQNPTGEEDYSNMVNALMNQSNQWAIEPGMQEEMINRLMNAMGEARRGGAQEYARGLNMGQMANKQAVARDREIQPDIESLLASILRSKGR